MAEITIMSLGNRQFQVQIRQGNQETTHSVDVPDRLPEGMAIHDEDLERVVRESVQFLLDREPASSILRQFSLTDIARYFPDYPAELSRRLASERLQPPT